MCGGGPAGLSCRPRACSAGWNSRPASFTVGNSGTAGRTPTTLTSLAMAGCKTGRNRRSWIITIGIPWKATAACCCSMPTALGLPSPSAVGGLGCLLDDDIVAVSPSSVYRVLKQAGRLDRKWQKPSKKGTGFVQPLSPHEHWHIDICVPQKRRERWEFGLPQSAYRSRLQTTISGCG